MLCVPQDWWTVTEEDGPGLMGGPMGVLGKGEKRKQALGFTLSPDTVLGPCQR